MPSRSLAFVLLLLLFATAASLPASAATSSSKDEEEDLQYLIDNANDIPASDPDGWLPDPEGEGGDDYDGDDDDDLLFQDQDQDQDLPGQQLQIDETHVVVLTAANFSSFLAASLHVMVEFYAPWCGHCQALAPDYAAAASHLAAHHTQGHVALAKVDATEDTDLAQKYDVQGFPTILFFIDGVPKDYNGARTKDAIVDWINKKLGPGGAHSDELAAASRLEDSVNFYQTSSPDVAKLFHIDPAAKRPTVVLLKKEEEKLTLFDGEFKASAIADFVSANKLPLLLFVFVERDNEEVGEPVANYFGITGQETTVLAYTGNEDARKFFLGGEVSLDAIKDFAKGFLEDKLTPFYKSEPVPESVSLDNYLISAFFTHSPSLKHPALCSQNDEDFKIVVGNDIDQIVLDESKDVLLEVCSWQTIKKRGICMVNPSLRANYDFGLLFFTLHHCPILCFEPGAMIYAPWCGHCQSLEPTYNKLAKHLRGIDSLVIAKMDGTANEHPRAKPDGYPTIVFYPAGKKSFEPVSA
ncbi:Protein disulfide isomerase-like 1-4 [Dichanthelium oligosanthes]|uniref:protein disulfide-isomerase n=1 Tax=Dichanthelium oligosanthes TaxID=888268 RepID=A0A1E5VCR9_9POAL|nr:Protein disulfide isomerase-like 1-4 [Dichanthelium oligosanthes]